MARQPGPATAPIAAASSSGAAAALAEYDQLLLAYVKPLTDMAGTLAPEVCEMIMMRRRGAFVVFVLLRKL